MCTEIFTALMKSNSNICRITVGNINIKISQYANDTVIITDGTFDSITEFSKVFSLAVYHG